MHPSIEQAENVLLKAKKVDAFLKSRGISATHFTMQPSGKRGFALRHFARTANLSLEWSVVISEDRPEEDGDRADLIAREIGEDPEVLREYLESDGDNDEEEEHSSKNHVILIVGLYSVRPHPGGVMTLSDLTYYPCDHSWSVAHDRSRVLGLMERGTIGEKMQSFSEGALQELAAFKYIEAMTNMFNGARRKT